MADVRIQIAVDPNGTFTGPPVRQHVEPQDRVSFYNRANGGKGAFEVVFQTDGTPFSSQSYQKISDNAAYPVVKDGGVFHYSVTAADDNGKLHSVRGCPDIEVDGA